MSLLSRLEKSQELINQKLQETRKLIPWFHDRTENVEAQRILTSDLWGKVSADFANLLDQLHAEIAVIQQDNRITIAEATEFVGRAIKLGYGIVIKYAATGEDRKNTVLLFVDEFYAKVLAPLDLPWIPNIGGFENRIIDPLLGKALHYIVEGLYNTIVDALVTPPPLPASTLGSSHV